MTALRVLVTGSRNWDDERTVRQALISVYVDADPDRLTVVHGACPTGADAIADAWATAVVEKAPETITVERHPADWQRLGKGAGFRRNAEMITAGADLCLAFIRDNSRGATHCLRLAQNARIPWRRWLA